MIRMNDEQSENGYAINVAIFVCDECANEISDCAQANLLYDPDHRDPQYHVHKHCMHVFEQKMTGLYAEELDTFLDFLCHNSRLDMGATARFRRRVLAAPRQKGLRRKETR